jgi:putative tryptophan/tyrosine transport system substrate-binding protein
MRRREFIAVIGAGAAMWPIGGRAQQASSVLKVGFLFGGPEAVAKMRGPLVLEGLRSEGFSEDQVTLVIGATGGDTARLAPVLAELTANKVDVLLPVAGTTRAAQLATAKIPIVMIDLEIDPIESGFLASLGHPGGNVTGIFLDYPDFSTTWLELLKGALPDLANIAVLWDPTTASLVQTKAIAAAAQRLNVKIEVIGVKAPAELDAAFETVSARHPDGLLILSSPFFSIYSKQIAELALKHRLPAISMFSTFARAGGLMAYGPNIDALYREAGVMAGKVLKGTKPADLPAERPARFELIVNLKAAKALNLTIPNLVLARADEVIE